MVCNIWGIKQMLPSSHCMRVPSVVSKVAQAVAGVFLAMGRAVTTAISWVKSRFVSSVDKKPVSPDFPFDQKIHDWMNKIPQKDRQEGYKQLNQICRSYQHYLMDSFPSDQGLFMENLLGSLPHFGEPSVVVRVFSYCPNGKWVHGLCRNLRQRDCEWSDFCLVLDQLSRGMQPDELFWKMSIICDYFRLRSGDITYGELQDCEQYLQTVDNFRREELIAAFAPYHFQSRSGFTGTYQGILFS